MTMSSTAFQLSVRKHFLSAKLLALERKRRIYVAPHNQVVTAAKLDELARDQVEAFLLRSELEGLPAQIEEARCQQYHWLVYFKSLSWVSLQVCTLLVTYTN